jgi:hypothetical protein
MKCLSDIQIQAIVDREASPEAVSHAAGCRRCGERVGEFGARASAVERAMAEPAVLPPAFAARMRESIENGAGARGATRLRQVSTARPRWLRAGWSTAAIAAAAIVAFVFVIPSIRGPQTVSAASILAESASRLSQVPASGIELREYELTLDGMPRELMRDQPDGRYRIWQAIDHGTPGRFRFASYAPDGKLLTSIAQDPMARNRVSVMRADDLYYRFEFTIPANDVPSLPEIERLHMEASIRMMQASGQQLLQETERDGRKHYLVEVPQVTTASANAPWDLTHARVLVDATDFRISEFQASGTFLQQPYAIAYKLLTRHVVSSVQPETFEVPHQAGEMIITGEGTANAAADALFAALRELAKARAAR